MSQPLVWNVDPVLLRAGPLQIRYYGIFFGLALVTGFAVWYQRVRRFGESTAFAEQWLWYGMVGVVVGGRLGHCFFYKPLTYIANPLSVLYIWEGGVSSHGVAIGLAVALWLFGRKHHVTWLRLGDYLAPAVALAVGWVRIGNFFNSEVLGHAATVPWAVVFRRVDEVPRHPAQLYDFCIGPITYVVLREVERRNIRPIGSGLIAGVFLAVYFSLRIAVEPFKVFFVEQWRAFPPFSTIENLVGFPIHTGQWLSVLPVCAGVTLIVRALRRFSAQPNELPRASSAPSLERSPIASKGIS
jgi:phosphatidylglycerol:prolipoprotein diacylglycerol transferase